MFDTVTDAAESGSQLEMLKSMRQVIAHAIDDPSTPGYALSALVRTGRDLAKDIEEIEERERAEDADGRDVASGDEAFRLEVI